MKLKDHADHTEKLCGTRAEDIHRWIDEYFDHEGLRTCLQRGDRRGFNPYDHRQHRHCVEALEEAYRVFEVNYSRDQIKAVFETHLRDDYGGYLPVRSDFEDGQFKEKYHLDNPEDFIEPVLSKAELEDYFRGKAYTARDKRNERLLSPRFWLRILLPPVLAILLFVIAIFAVVLPQERSNLMAQKRLMIQELTRGAVSVVRLYVDKAKAGEMTEGEAQRAAANAVGSLRYGEEMKDYFWITDMHPRMIMHPYREDLVGSDLTYYQDRENKSGKRLFAEFVKLVEAENEGYLHYNWQWKDDPNRVAPKLSYVRGIPEWGWIVGTGIYTNDVEAELDRLSNRLLVIFLAVAAGLVLALFITIRQSLGIEHRRGQAESGLREAKDRYRALVEASSEGYILEVDGEPIYASHALEQLFGYAEDEFLEKTIWNSILPDIPANRKARHNIELVFAGESVRGEFEAEARSKSGSLQDVVITISRNFFPNKNGHSISIRPIVRRKSDFFPTVPSADGPVDLTEEILESETEGHIIRVLNRVPGYLHDRIREGRKPEFIRRVIADTYHATVKRLIERVLPELPPPPCPFLFLSLGSAARREMTIFSDQDNALVFFPEAGQDVEAVRMQFLLLGKQVCDKLNKAGFPYCEGGLMAANPKWCLSRKEWCEQAARRFAEPTAGAIREVNVCLDLFNNFGDRNHFDELQGSVLAELDKSPNFLAAFARDCLRYRLPLNAFGLLQKGSDKRINIKDCLTPVILLARIYALRHRLREPSTSGRLRLLGDIREFGQTPSRELRLAFDQLWQLRFESQSRAHEDLRQVDDFLDLSRLSDLEKQQLKSTLATMSTYQNKLSHDFLGLTLEASRE